VLQFTRINWTAVCYFVSFTPNICDVYTVNAHSVMYLRVPNASFAMGDSENIMKC